MDSQPADTPDVSVVIANYNAARFLAAALDSVLAQTGVALEVILVDDVSSDDGVAVARRIADADPRLRVVEMATNGGPAAARNRGFDLARGRWVAVFDSDDLLEPGRFAALVAAGEAARADIVADDLLVFVDGSAAPPERFLSPADHGAPFRLELGDYLRRSILYGGAPNPGFLKPMFRRSALIAAGARYDESLRIAEDDDLIVRLLLAGLTYLVVPEPRYFYRKHAASISHRLTLAAIRAIVTADAQLHAAVIAARPDLRLVADARHAAFARAAAFETLIAALKQRDAGAAMATVLAHPGVLPMLRMPLAGAVRKLRPSRAAQSIDPAAQERALRDVAALLLRP